LTVVDERIDGSGEGADDLEEIIVVGQLLGWEDMALQSNNDLAAIVDHIATIDVVPLQQLESVKRRVNLLFVKEHCRMLSAL
jgi:hypothetical protein